MGLTIDPATLAAGLIASETSNVLGPAIGSLSSIHQQAGPFAAVDACVAAEMRQQNTPGASLAIAVGGRQVYTQTYGVKHSVQGGAIHPSTYFRINSTTKMMTAAAVMQAVERGQLDLHAPITDYLPDLELRAPWQASALTPHHLLSNSAGLPGGYVDLGRIPVGRPAADMSLQAWAGTLRQMHLFAPPESFFNYSSAGFSLAAAALEQATGRPYPELVEEGLWQPAGMLRTTMNPEVVIADGDYATGHYAGRHWDPREYQEPFAEPAGGAYATPSELLKWAGMLAEGGRGVLAPESVAAMTTAHAQVANVPITNYAGYGYGIFVEDFRRAGGSGETARVLYHPGNGRGYSTELFWVPETGFAVAILANTPTGLNQSALCALREVEGLTRLPVDRSPPAAAELERLTGTYALVDEWGNAWTARVWTTPDGLHIVYSDWSTLPTIGAAVPEAPMSHLYGSRFRYEGYGRNDALFVDAAPGDPHPRWLEHLSIVGQRAGDLPAEIEMAGRQLHHGQADAGPGRPGQPAARRRPAAGLLPGAARPPGRSRAARPALRSSSTCRPTAEVAFLMAYHWPAGNDDLDMYLLHDANGDGDFAYPAELVDATTGPGAQGFVARTPLPAGDYQLWIHGRQVSEAGSGFQLDVVMVAGDGPAAAGRARDAARPAWSTASSSAPTRSWPRKRSWAC